jgi:hypothetical protein
MQARIRLWVKGELKCDDTANFPGGVIEILRSHEPHIANGARHLIEYEWLHLKDPEMRFFSVGDPEARGSDSA